MRQRNLTNSTGTSAETVALPPLIDVQVNGYGGLSFNSPQVRPEDVRAITERLWGEGVGAYCPTVVTGARERMLRSIRTVAEARRRWPEIAVSLVGLHVEGPFLSPEDGPRGAHPREHVRAPSYAEYADWQEAAEGTVRIVTLSPEWPEALEFIERVAADGVIVAIGHTAAPPERIREAVAAGARMSTHLGNGAHALLPRHPNYIWEQLAEDRLWASFIADGHHLPPATLKAMLRAKGPDRSVLVSDAVRFAGMAPGRYRAFSGQEVEVLPNGRVQLAGTPYLAGAGLPLLHGIATVARLQGFSREDGIRMATETPAQLLRLCPESPSIPSGTVRVRWEDRPVVLETVLNGRTVYRSEAHTNG